MIILIKDEQNAYVLSSRLILLSFYLFARFPAVIVSPFIPAHSVEYESFIAAEESICFGILFLLLFFYPFGARLAADGGFASCEWREERKESIAVRNVLPSVNKLE